MYTFIRIITKPQRFIKVNLIFFLFEIILQQVQVAGAEDLQNLNQIEINLGRRPRRTIIGISVYKS